MNLLSLIFVCYKEEANKRKWNALFVGLKLLHGTIIKMMTLLNMLVICGNKPPVAVAIYDFIGYIVDDVKKDVEFTQSFSKAKVDEFNST